MKTVMAGITGWVSLERVRSRRVQAADSALTIVGTLLVVVSLVLLRG